MVDESVHQKFPAIFAAEKFFPAPPPMPASPARNGKQAFEDLPGKGKYTAEMYDDAADVADNPKHLAIRRQTASKSNTLTLHKRRRMSDPVQTGLQIPNP
jgi:hypothetical protein